MINVIIQRKKVCLLLLTVLMVCVCFTNGCSNTTSRVEVDVVTEISKAAAVQLLNSNVKVENNQKVEEWGYSQGDMVYHALTIVSDDAITNTTYLVECDNQTELNHVSFHL